MEWRSPIAKMVPTVCLINSPSPRLCLDESELLLRSLLFVETEITHGQDSADRELIAFALAMPWFCLHLLRSHSDRSGPVRAILG